MPKRCDASDSSSLEEPVEEEGSKSITAEDSPPRQCCEDLHKTPESSPVSAPITNSAFSVWDRRAFLCLALGLCIVAISIFDYISRISMATFIATYALTFQNVDLTFLTAAILTSASAVLPSIAFGVCCGSHLRSTGSWACTRAASLVHLFAVPKARLREQKRLYSDFFALALLHRASQWRFSCGRSAAVRRAATTCVLPPAAAACLLLLCVQVTVVAALSFLALAALWGCNALGFVVFKAFFMHRETFLCLLDCLTRGSALQLRQPNCETSSNCILTTPASNAEAAPDGGTYNPQEGSEILHASKSAAVAPPSRLQQGLRAANDEKANCVCGRTGCDKETCDGNCFNASKGTGVNFEHAESLGRERTHTRGKSHQLSSSQHPDALGCKCHRCLERIDAHASKNFFYTKATLWGSVPRQLHPCPALKGAVRLHRQHLKKCREGHCIAENRGRQLAHSTSTCRLSESADLQAGQARESTSEWQNARSSAGGCRFPGSGGGPLAVQESPPVADDEVHKKYWASGLEAETVNIPFDAAGTSSRELSANDSPNGAGLLAFAYAASFHRAESAKDAVTEAKGRTLEEPDRTYSAVQNVGVFNCSDMVVLQKASVASLVASGSGPYRWMRHQLKQRQGADPPCCPPTSPSHKALAPRFSRPGIPHLDLSSKKLSRLDSFRQQTLRLTSGPHEAGGSEQVLKLFFTAPAVPDVGVESKEDQFMVKGFWPHFLKRKKQRPAPAQLNDSQFEDLVLQREHRIFDWYESLVAFRYAEVTRTGEAKKPLDGDKSEDFPASCDRSDSLMDVKPLPLSEEECGIKWSTFETLFLQDCQDSCDNQVELHTLPSTAKTESLHEPHKVTCMHTEDLFDLDVPETRTYHPLVRVRGKREEPQPAKARAPDTKKEDVLDCLSSPRSHDCQEGGDGAAVHACSSEEGSSPHEHIQPIIHYRFKDMVEMPHLREVMINISKTRASVIFLVQQYEGRCFLEAL